MALIATVVRYDCFGKMAPRATTLMRRRNGCIIDFVEILVTTAAAWRLVIEHNLSFSFRELLMEIFAIPSTEMDCTNWRSRY